MNKLIATALLVSLLLTNTVYAIGISPSRTEIDFEPGLSETFTFYVVNTEKKAMDVGVYKTGDLSEYITLSTNSLSFSQVDSVKSFTVTLNLPQSIEKPGISDNRIGIIESLLEGIGIGARAGVEAQLWVRVPYPGYYAEVGFDAPDVAVGDTTNFTISITSRGTESMTASGRILVYDGEVQIATLDAGQVSLEPDESKTLQAEWSTQGIKPGLYRAVASVNYPGKTVEVEKTFHIGTLQVEILNISSTRVQLGEIAKFDVALQSIWNEPISDVYVELEIIEGINSPLKTKSETFSLGSWETRTVKIYADTEKLSEGLYDVRATVYYANQTTVKELEKGLEIVTFVLDTNILLVVLL